MSVPPGAYYYDLVYGACEPCFNRTSGQNECVYQGPDPRDVNWIVDDDDVFPPDARGCGPSEKYDLLMQQCRPLCPGEGSGGQEFVYAADNKSGSCVCYDPDHFMFDPQSGTCIPKVATSRQLALTAARRLRLNPGDVFPPCNADAGLVETCYFGDADSCLDVFAEAPFIGDDVDDDVIPPDARGCGQDERYDLLLKQCRGLCPGEEKGGMEYFYSADNGAGYCACRDPEHRTFDEATKTCVLAKAPHLAAARAVARKARYESCPFTLCSTLNPQDCVCVGSQLGNRVQAVGKHKKRKMKK